MPQSAGWDPKKGENQEHETFRSTTATPRNVLTVTKPGAAASGPRQIHPFRGLGFRVTPFFDQPSDTRG